MSTTTDRNLAAGKAARDAAAMEQRWAEGREWMGDVDFAVFDRIDELLEEPDPRVIGLATAAINWRDLAPLPAPERVSITMQAGEAEPQPEPKANAKPAA
jgi:hypothetical protein